MDHFSFLKMLESPGFYIGLFVKILGYAVFLHYWFKKKLPATLAIAALRTGVGAVTGALLLLGMATFESLVPFYFALTAARAIEWFLLLKMVAINADQKEQAKFILAGVMVSLALDVPLLAGWLMTAGGIC
ncbi:MAG: hypothetical protein H7333_06985 [Bdellovibrionales bacterium]|nr:hypothetical protein [Oligoflexia bacterium]